MNCEGLIPPGKAAEACVGKQITSLIFLKKGTSFATYVEASSLEAWRVLIQEALTAYPTLDPYAVAPTKSALAKETAQSGENIGTRLDPGGAIVDLKTSGCDFKQLVRAMKGGNYAVCFGLDTSEIMMLEDQLTGSLTGFSGQCTALPTTMPGKDGKITENQVDINWQDVKEWDYPRVIQLPAFLKKLNTYVPAGLDVQINTVLAATAMKVLMTQRCLGDFEADTLTFEVNVKKTTAGMISPSVVPTLDADGIYDLLVQKSVVPEALASGEAIVGNFVKLTGSVYEKISEELIILQP